MDQDEDAGSGVGSPDADGVEPAAVTEGDLAGFVDGSVRTRLWESVCWSPAVALGRAW